MIKKVFLSFFNLITLRNPKRYASVFFFYWVEEVVAILTTTQRKSKTKAILNKRRFTN